MSSMYTSTTALSVCFLCALTPACAVVCGQGSQSAERWTFAVETFFDEIPVSGTMNYDLVGYDTKYVDDVGYEVDVLRVTGSFSGTSSLSGVEYVVSGVYDGYIYQVRGSVAVVMSQMSTIANTSSQMGTLQMAEQVDVLETICYSPPLMAGFDPETAQQGDQWNETVEVRQETSYNNDTVSIDEETTEVTHTEFWVDFVGEVVQTEAGVFDCIKLISSQESNSEVTWYSSDVGRSVRTERYDNTSTEPVYVALLSSHQKSDDADRLVSLLVIMGVAVSAIVLAVMVMFAMRRRSRLQNPPGELEDAPPISCEEGRNQEDAPGNGR